MASINKQNKFKNKLTELFGIDLKSLAVFRIFLAGIIIVDLIQRTRDLEAFYSDSGAFPRGVFLNQYPSSDFISLHLISGNVYVQFFLFFIALIFAVCLFFGFCTKLSTIFSWIFMLSLHVRNPILCIGGDELIRMLLFWGMFLPLGACYSLDSVISSPGKKISGSVFSAASVALFGQVALLYWISVGFKIRHKEWLNGEAIYYAISNDHYATELGKILFGNYELMKFLTHASLWLEIIAPFLLFVPVFTPLIRTIIVFALMIFQISMGMFIELTIFPWANCVSVIPFISGKFWEVSKIENLINLIPFERIAIFISNCFAKSVEKFPFLAFVIMQKPVNLSSSVFINVLVSFFFVYVMFWNFWALNPKFKFPAFISWLGPMVRINQGWSLYCPPPSVGYWFVIPATQKNGKVVDLFTDGKPVNWKMPDGLVTKLYKNRHWRAFYLNLAWRSEARGVIFPYLSWYLFKDWNKKHKGDKQITELRIYLMYISRFSNYKTEGPYSQGLWIYPALPNSAK